MIKENKLKIILSTIGTLLPILIGLILWNKLPDNMWVHWGADGVADGSMSKLFVVFLTPVLMAVLNLICFFVMSLDKKGKEINKKALNVIFWIIPIISLFINGAIYSFSLGNKVDFIVIIPVLFGLLFLVIGNYLPKVKQNSVYGIKIYWTLNNEENWNKTHRLGGKVLVISGLFILFSALLPFKAAIFVFVSAIIVSIAIPVIFSYKIYKEHKKQRIEYGTPNKKSTVLIGATSLLTVVFVAIFMFVGKIDVSVGEKSFKIDATFNESLEVLYTDIDNISLREDLAVGSRVMGFGSAKLSIGNFQNEEFGAYTIYAYTNAEKYLVLESDGQKLVIGLDKESIDNLYNTLTKNITYTTTK